MRVGLIGTYGTGNLGDESILIAFLQWLHHRAPDVEPMALCANPAHIAQTYGVTAFPVSAYHAAREPASAPDAPASPPAPLPAMPLSPDERPKAPSGLRGQLKRLLPAPIRWMRSAQHAVSDARTVARFLPQQLRIARSLDAVVVLGGGQVHDFWDGPLGHSATLFCWALACRVARKPYCIVSTGAIDLDHRLSRWFVRKAFDWSRFVSIRDQPTSRVVRSLRVRQTLPVGPDLAWGLRGAYFLHRSGQPAGAHVPAPSASMRRVGVCPMVYRHPQLWPGGDADAYRHDVAELAEFCSRLVREGHEVVLFPTQIRSDVVAIQDVVAQMAPELAKCVEVRRLRGVVDLHECLASVDAVVSSRFHGLLLALLMGRPAISVSYQEKNDALLQAFGQGHFALDIHRFSADSLWHAFTQLRDEFDHYTARIGPHVRANRARLDAQYLQILHELGWEPAARADAMSRAQ